MFYYFFVLFYYFCYASSCSLFSFLFFSCLCLCFLLSFVVLFYYFHYVLCFCFSFAFGFCFVSSPLLSLRAGVDPLITVSKPLKGQSQVLKLRSASSVHCVLYGKKCNALWPIKKLFNAFTPEYSFTVPFFQMAGGVAHVLIKPSFWGLELHCTFQKIHDIKILSILLKT